MGMVVVCTPPLYYDGLFCYTRPMKKMPVYHSYARYSTRQYLIHFVLCYGTFEDMHWLLHRYVQEKIETIFIGYPMKIYSKQTFLFIKNFILNLRDVPLNEAQYVAYTWKRFPGKFGPPPVKIWSTD